MKKYISLLLCAVIMLTFAACASKRNENTTAALDEDEQSTKETLVIETTADSIETTVHKISDKPLDNETYTDNFDPNALAIISSSANALTAEIKSGEKTDDIKKLSDSVLEKYKSTDSYKTLISLDLALVKPSYYIMSKSGKNGIFEKVLCMAISDVTGVKAKDGIEPQKYIAFYGKTANKAVTDFNEIMQKDISEDEKLTQIKEIGIFAVAQLIDQMDKGALSYDKTLEFISQIVKEKTGVDLSEDFTMWRAENEVNYRNILDTL